MLKSFFLLLTIGLLKPTFVLAMAGGPVSDYDWFVQGTNPQVRNVYVGLFMTADATNLTAPDGTPLPAHPPEYYRDLIFNDLQSVSSHFYNVSRHQFAFKHMIIHPIWHELPKPSFVPSAADPNVGDTIAGYCSLPDTYGGTGYCPSLSIETRQFMEQVYLADRSQGDIIISIIRGFGAGYAGTGYTYISGNPDWDDRLKKTLTHELGHILELKHSNACTYASPTLSLFPIFDPNLPNGDCYPTKYGGFADPMGSATFSQHFNVNNQLQLGWLDYATEVQVPQHQGVYELRAVESPIFTGTRMLEFEQGGQVFTVEYRNPQSYAWEDPGQYLERAVYIHAIDNQDSDRTDIQITYAIKPGDTNKYYDPGRRLTVKVIQWGPDSAFVEFLCLDCNAAP